MTKEQDIEQGLISKLEELKYKYRSDICDRATLEANFRRKFEELNKVHLSDSEFERLKEQIVNPDVFTAAEVLRERNTFQREDDTPLQYTLVNIKDWCKNTFEASILLKDNPDIEKCLFVVDRKDLDRQTREEFNRFQPLNIACVFSPPAEGNKDLPHAHKLNTLKVHKKGLMQQFFPNPDEANG